MLSHYVEYVSFKTFIKKTESELWNFNFYKPIIKQIINVVSYCHLNKITHGDFNHNNILICPVEKNIRIIDFGSSKKNSSTFGNLYSPSGNPKYRPPVEDFFFADSFQCECWSVGLVLMSLVLKDIITTKKVLHSKPKPCEKIQNLELDKTFVKVLNGLMLRGKDRYNIFEASKLLENVLSS